MERSKALEKFGLNGNEDASIIQSKYNEMYNDFRLMIENAPTPKLKESYERNLLELEEAYRSLSTVDTLKQEHTSTEDLPLISKVNSTAVTSENPNEVSKIDSNQVFEYFGCDEKVSDKQLMAKYHAMIRTLEQEVKKQILPQARKIYEDELVKAKAMWEEVRRIKPNIESNNSTREFDAQKIKKITAPVMIALGVIAIACFIIFSNVFKESSEDVFEKATVLVRKGDIKSLNQAEILLNELLEVEEFNEKAKDWLEIVVQQKNALIQGVREKYQLAIEKSQYLEADKYWNQMNAMFEITDPKAILEHDEVRLKAATQKLRIDEYLNEAQISEAQLDFDAAIEKYQLVEDINPSNKVIVGKIDVLNQQKIIYANCLQSYQDAQGALSISRPGEELYRLAMEKINQINLDCPGLVSAMDSTGVN